MKKPLKVIIAVFIGILAIWFIAYGLSFFFDYTKPENPTSINDYFYIQDIKNPAYIKWLDNDTLLFSTIDYNNATSTLYTYDVIERELTEQYQISQIGIFNIQDEKTIFCTWKNMNRKSAADYGTQISIFEISGNSTTTLMRDTSIYEIVSLTDCNTGTTSARIENPIFIEGYFLIDISSGKVSSSTKPTFDTTVLSDYKTPPDEVFVSFYLNPDTSLAVTLIENGDLIISPRKM